MARARAAFGLCAALGIAGLAVVLSSMFIALARVNIAAPTTAGLIAACRGWVLPHGGLVALSVLGLGSLAVAVVVLTMRSALRQVHAIRQFERGLRVVGCLPPDPRVRLVDDPTPQAFCVGLLRPRIHLSVGAVELLSDSERQAVLAHELHHARRHDPLRLLVARSLGEGLFFLPAVGRLAQRYAALAELAADEAAESAPGGRRALASALLAFDAHPDPAAVGIATERVDRLLGQRLSWELPVLAIAGTAATLAAFGALTIRLMQATDHATISLPTLLAQACMLAMAGVPLFLGAWCMLGGRRLFRHR
jgi:hypothetical protein